MNDNGNKERLYTMDEVLTQVGDALNRFRISAIEAHVETMKEARKKYLIQGTTIGLLLACGMFLLVGLVDSAISREDAFNEGIRLDRCAAYNGNIPEEMKGYCGD